MVGRALFNPGVNESPTHYRLARSVVVRLLGLGLLVLAALVFAATLVVTLTDVGPDLLVAVALAGLAVLGLGAWWLTKRAYVVRATVDGYRIGVIRSAGVREARWNQVEDAVTATIKGVPVVVLRLKAGATTTIPVTVLAIDREEFVRELQQLLQRGHRLRQV
jgi:hypothetical protein